MSLYRIGDMLENPVYLPTMTKTNYTVQVLS